MSQVYLSYKKFSSFDQEKAGQVLVLQWTGTEQKFNPCVSPNKHYINFVINNYWKMLQLGQKLIENVARMAQLKPQPKVTIGILREISFNPIAKFA